MTGFDFSNTACNSEVSENSHQEAVLIFKGLDLPREVLMECVNDKIIAS